MFRIFDDLPLELLIYNQPGLLRMWRLLKMDPLFYLQTLFGMDGVWVEEEEAALLCDHQLCICLSVE